MEEKFNTGDIAVYIDSFNQDKETLYLVEQGKGVFANGEGWTLNLVRYPDGMKCQMSEVYLDKVTDPERLVKAKQLFAAMAPAFVKGNVISTILEESQITGKYFIVESVIDHGVFVEVREYFSKPESDLTPEERQLYRFRSNMFRLATTAEIAIVNTPDN